MRTTTRAVGTSFTHLVFFPCSCCHSSGPSARCGFTVVTDILLYTNIHHPPPFLAHLLSTSLSEPGADPYSISNSAFHSFFFFFFFNWHCWVQEMLSTYLFLSGCKFLSEFALYMCRRVYCHRRSKGRRIAPRLLSVSSISVDTSPSPPPLHSRWKAQLVAGEYFGLFYLCTRVPVERSTIFSGHRVPV